MANILTNVDEIDGWAVFSCPQDIRYSRNFFSEVLGNRVHFLALSEKETYGPACIRPERSKLLMHRIQIANGIG